MNIICEECGKAICKKASEIARTRHNFCSRRCSVTFRNRVSPRQPKLHKCLGCKVFIRSGYSYCNSCATRNKDYTIAEVVYNQHHKSSAFAFIRTRARAIARKLNWTTCIQCGYSKHVEIAHKMPISSFSKDTKLSIVNSPDNLIPLCPNCHWEFDNSNTG